MLELHDLTRRFGELVALDGVSFQVAPGQMLGFVGPNGAGKTTAMRIVLGLLEADAGEVHWNGVPMTDAMRRRIGYMPEERGLYPKMRVAEHLVYLSELGGRSRAEATAEADALLARLGLRERRDDRVEQLSLGNQQRVQLAAALLDDPPLLVLDEPFSGLDPIGVDALASVLHERVEAGTPVVFSSHQLDLVERLCDAVAIINGGRIVASGTVEELRSRDGDVTVRVELGEEPRTGWLDAAPVAVEVVEKGQRRWLVRVADRAAAQTLLAHAERQGEIVTFAEVRPDLATLFRSAVEPPVGVHCGVRGGGLMRLRAVWLVARRELRERLRDKSLYISTGITLVLLLVFALGPRVLGFDEPDRFTLATVGPDARQLAAAAGEQAPELDAEVEVVEAADRGRAETLLRDEEADAALLGDRALLVLQEAPAELVRLVQSASSRVRVTDQLQDAGLGREQVREVLAPPSLPVEALQPSDEQADALGGLAFLVVFVLYGQLFGYGMAVASGVVEEKASRVVEIILSKLRPTELLAGKVLGIGLVGLVQLALIAVAAIVLVEVTGLAELPAGAARAFAAAFGWFVLGYTLYAAVFAAAGALVSRQEELQNVVGPISLFVLGAFFLSFAALSDPDSTLAVVGSLLPVSAPLVMAVRMTVGAAAPWEIVASILVMAVTVVGVILLAARIYRGGVLQTGNRIRLRQALAASRDVPARRA